MQRSALGRSRREPSNAYLLASFCFDTAENEPCKVCPIERCFPRGPPRRSGERFEDTHSGTEPEAAESHEEVTQSFLRVIDCIKAYLLNSEPTKFNITSTWSRLYLIIFLCVRLHIRFFEMFIVKNLDGEVKLNTMNSTNTCVVETPVVFHQNAVSRIKTM